MQTKVTDGIATIHLDDGKANAVDPEFVAGLDAGMDQALAEKAKILVIKGRPGYFSAGLNLKKLPLLGPDEFRDFSYSFSEVLLRLYAFPTPTVALVEGHAMAAGAVLLLGCDYRVALDIPCKIGLNETQIHLPLPSFCLEMARTHIPPQHMQKGVLEGNTFAPQEAAEIGYCSHVFSSDDWDAEVQQLLLRVKLISNDAYRITKGRLRDPVRAAGLASAKAEYDAEHAKQHG